VELLGAVAYKLKRIRESLSEVLLSFLGISDSLSLETSCKSSSFVAQYDCTSIRPPLSLCRILYSATNSSSTFLLNFQAQGVVLSICCAIVTHPEDLGLLHDQQVGALHHRPLLLA